MIRAGHQRTGDARQWAVDMVGKLCLAAATGAMLCALTARAAEKPAKEQPRPWVTMSLRSLGVPSMPPSMMKVGASMLTLDMVDDSHLLLTFSSRGLVPRLPDDPPEDEDRMVRAEVVELPSGRIVATTDWHMHDHARYLWPMGKGRFMVRSRHTLFVITPRALMKTADPLKPLAFPNRNGMPVDVVVSPDENMLTVETRLPPKKATAEKMDTGLVVEDPKPQVMLDFYRMAGGDESGQPLKLSAVGDVLAPGAILLPMDGDGYLWAGEPQRGRWPLSFNEFGGREVKIGPVDSSCPPRLQMVSRFEFLAFTCMASDSRTKMKAFGMDGHETWEENVGGTYGQPEFAFAPSAGRFAISRITSTVGELDQFAGAAIPDGSTQEVRVYQTESGDLLLKMQTNPVARFGENFDLSEDGLTAAVVNDGEVQVYRLPPPSKQDVKDLEVARGFAPPVSDAAVSLAKLAKPPDEPRENLAATNAGDVAGSSGSGPAKVTPADIASSAKPSLVGAAPSGNSGGEPAPPSTAAAAATDATQGAVAPSPAAGMKAASATKDSADDISDEEVAKILGARLPAAAPATKEMAGGPAGDSGKVNPGAAASGDAAAKSVSAAQASGDSAEQTPRKPPTLLEPGEKVETVKGSGRSK